MTRAVWLALAAFFAGVAVLALVAPRRLPLPALAKAEARLLARVVGVLATLLALSSFQHRNGVALWTQRLFGATVVGLAALIYDGGVPIPVVVAVGAVGAALVVLAKDGMDFVMM